MNLRGMVLIGFSAGCLAVAGIAHHNSKSGQVSNALANLSTKNNGLCETSGFETSAGHVGCLQQVSFNFIKGKASRAKSYFGGDAMNRR